MANTSVFTRLRRLFSTDVLIRNVGGSKLKVLDFSKYQQTGQVEKPHLIKSIRRQRAKLSTALSTLKAHTA